MEEHGGEEYMYAWPQGLHLQGGLASPILSWQVQGAVEMHVHVTDTERDTQLSAVLHIPITIL